MYTIAITGGIGSGKTAVTDYLSLLGYKVIDTDKLAHDITAPGGKAIPYILKNFGNEYLMEDGSMNRPLMRQLVYNNPEKRALLEAGTTEVIIKDTALEIEKCRTRGDKAVFVAIPLLFEKGSPSQYDLVWSVIADENLRLERVRSRDNFDENMIRNIFDIQASDAQRVAGSTDVIDNSGSLNQLYHQVNILLQKYNLR